MHRNVLSSDLPGPTASMKCTLDPSELLAAPIGRYYAGASFVAWVQSPTRIGLFHTALFDRSDECSLSRILPLPTSPLLGARFDFLHDLEAIRVCDQRAFRLFQEQVITNVDTLARRVRRLAIVRPAGLAGAALAGMFYEWVVPRFDAKLVDTRAHAYDFLDVSTHDRDELDSLAVSEQIWRMRRVLDALERNVRRATLASIAASVPISVRSLQRLFAAHRTTFRRELAKARVRVAEAILLDRDDKLEAIAREVGFRSASSFSTMFTQATGEAPGVFRAKAKVGHGVAPSDVRAIEARGA